MVRASSVLILFGGEDAKRRKLNDLHMFDLKSLTWLPLHCTWVVLVYSLKLCWCCSLLKPKCSSRHLCHGEFHFLCLSPYFDFRSKRFFLFVLIVRAEEQDHLQDPTMWQLFMTINICIYLEEHRSRRLWMTCTLLTLKLYVKHLLIFHLFLFLDYVSEQFHSFIEAN